VHYGGEKLGCTVIPVSGGVTARQVQLITELRPRIITMTPSYMLTVIDEIEKQGLDPRATSLEIGVFGAEPWTERMRAEIEERTGIQAVDIYGLSEVIGPGVAQECAEAKDGLTIWEDHFYPEVVDPVTGAVLPEGTEGELVFTSLTRQASPVIRYRTRDLTRLQPGTARPAMRRMAKVTGRSDDMMIIRGTNLFPTKVEEIVLRTPGLSPHFALELSTRGRLDHLTVRAEARPGFPAEDWPQAAAALAEAVRDAVGLGIEADVVPPETLPRSEGKLQRVRDLRSRA
jgi:phenylacetate-CoA ligase